MASINGFSLKNVTDFVGQEGDCKQGDLYLGPKKLLFWSDDMHGGSMWYDREPTAPKEEYESQVNAVVSDMDIGFFSNVESLIDLLIVLNDLEDSWKNLGKRPSLAFWNYLSWTIYPLNEKEQSMSLYELLSKKNISTIRKEFEQQCGFAKTTVFRTNDDFIIENRF